MPRIRSHLTYANVMVTLLAIAVLGGGVAYAAKALEKNSVTSKSIRNGQVKPKDLADASTIAEGLQPNAVVAIKQDAPHPIGPQGEGGQTLTCPDNGVAVGGGAKWIGHNGGPIIASGPTSTGPGNSGWFVSLYNNAFTTPASFSTYVICIKTE